MAQKGEIILYTTPDGESKIEVKLEGETVWLTLDQMATLFQRNKSTISRYVKNVLESGELEKEEVVAKNAITTQQWSIERESNCCTFCDCWQKDNGTRRRIKSQVFLGRQKRNVYLCNIKHMKRTW